MRRPIYCDECGEVIPDEIRGVPCFGPLVGHYYGGIQGTVPTNMIGTPAHEEALRMVEKGYDVWWDSGEVVGPETSMASYSLWDYYNSDTGSEVKEE